MNRLLLDIICGPVGERLVAPLCCCQEVSVIQEVGHKALPEAPLGITDCTCMCPMAIHFPGTPDRRDNSFLEIRASQLVKTALTIAPSSRDDKGAYCLPNPLIYPGLQLNGKCTTHTFLQNIVLRKKKNRKRRQCYAIAPMALHTPTKIQNIADSV